MNTNKNSTAYILSEQTLYPYSGIFDFYNEETIPEDQLSIKHLAKDIAESLTGIECTKVTEYKVILESLQIYNPRNTRKQYGLIHQIKRTLGFDFELIITSGTSAEKRTALKLLKVLYQFTKLTKSKEKDLIELFQNPSLDVIRSCYSQNPYFEKVENFKRILDDLSKKYVGENSPEIGPHGFEDFDDNEAIFRAAFFDLASIYHTSKLNQLRQRLNKHIKEIESTPIEPYFKTKSNKSTHTNAQTENSSTIDNDSSTPHEDPSILIAFTHAINHYYLKCINQSYLIALEDIRESFKKHLQLKITSEQHLAFRTFHRCSLSDLSSKEPDVALEFQLLQNPKVYTVVLGHNDMLTEEEEKHLSFACQHFQTIYNGYRNINRQEHLDIIDAYESSKHYEMAVSILHLLYLSSAKHLQYKPYSFGGETKKKSAKMLLASRNLATNPDKRKKLIKEYLETGKASGNLPDFSNNPFIEEFYDEIYLGDEVNADFFNQNKKSSGKERNSGQDKLIEKLLPQLLFAWNNLGDEHRFYQYIDFLKSYHTLQIQLCKFIDPKQFLELSNTCIKSIADLLDEDWYSIRYPDYENIKDSNHTDSTVDTESIIELLMYEFFDDGEDTAAPMAKIYVKKRCPEKLDFLISELAKLKNTYKDCYIPRIIDSLKKLKKETHSGGTLYDSTIDSFSNCTSTVISILKEDFPDCFEPLYYFLNKVFSEVSKNDLDTLKLMFTKKKVPEYNHLYEIFKDKLLNEYEILNQVFTEDIPTIYTDIAELFSSNDKNLNLVKKIFTENTESQYLLLRYFILH